MFKNFFPKYKKWNPNKAVRLFILFIPILLFFVTFKIDNDFWFLISTGKYILNHGFTTIEPFTIHEGLAFIPQQWLTDIIFYLLYSKLGIYGIFFFLMVINAIIIYLMYKICLLITENKIKLSLLITIITDFILEISVFTTRPQIFDITFLLLELYLLELYIKKKKNKYLIGLPIISLLMINLHASIWPMIFVFLVPYYLGKIKLKNTLKEDYKIIPLIITTIIMIIVGFINPYHIEAIKYFFNSYGIKFIDSLVGEMKPINIRSMLILYVYIFIILLSYYFSRNKKVNIRYLLLTLGTMYLLLEHYKGLVFFSVTSILSLSYNFKNYFKDENKEYVNIKYIEPTIISLMIILFSVLVINVKIENESQQPLYKIGNYLKKNVSKDIKLYTNYNNGSYLEYLGYKVYIDPRAEVFLKKNNKKEDILEEYFNFEIGKIDYQEFFDKYKFDYLVIDSDELVYLFMKDFNYELVYESCDNKKELTYQLYKRR